MAKKIGILGGTFDPFHKGHFMLAETAYRQFMLDEVWILPNGNPPHKKEIQQTDFQTRCQMILLAIKNTGYMKLCTAEAAENEYHYTYQTLEFLNNQYPAYEFYFIIGADSLKDFPHWKEPEKIAKLCTLLVACRDQAGIAELKKQSSEIENIFGGICKIMNSPKIDAASNEIRSMIDEGRNAEKYLHKKVLEFIQKKRLYRGSQMTDYDLKLLEKQMKEELSDDRYEHTLGVMYTAEALAMRYGIDMTKAAVAGLLHDCAKCIPNQQKLKMCRKHCIEITSQEEKNPSLLHAKLGAYMAKKAYHVDDEEILNAIRWHTTGKPEMSMLEMIIYMADYIEPHRDKAPNLKEIRRLSFENIEEALYQVLESTLCYLQKTSPEAIDSMTMESWKFYKNKLNK